MTEPEVTALRLRAALIADRLERTDHEAAQFVREMANRIAALAYTAREFTTTHGPR